jgi:hypothetical protein
MIGRHYFSPKYDSDSHYLKGLGMRLCSGALTGQSRSDRDDRRKQPLKRLFTFFIDSGH